MFSTKHHNQRGFTLIELLVTITVVAIIASMAAPSFSNMIAGYKLDTEARVLALIFGDARGQATALRKNITIKFEKGINNSTTYYWLPESSQIQFKNVVLDVVFTPTGMAKQRQIMVDNADYNPLLTTDMTTTPPTNPQKIPKLLDLEFILCDASKGMSRTVRISKVGTIDKIQSGTCS